MAVDQHPIVIFDGLCNFCDRTIQFMIRHDVAGVFRFAPRQNPFAQDLISRLKIDQTNIDSIILVEGDTYYERSDASLRIASRLSPPWSWASSPCSFAVCCGLWIGIERLKSRAILER